MTKKSADINYISKDLFPKYYNRTMIDDDYIKQLEQENKHLDKVNCHLRKNNEKLKDNWNNLKEWLNNFHKISEFEQWEIVKKMQEIEGSDNNE